MTLSEVMLVIAFYDVEKSMNTIFLVSQLLSTFTVLVTNPHMQFIFYYCK